MLNWILKFTPLKKFIEFFEGKKQALASLATALVATGTIVAKTSELGISYLMHVASTPEFAAASLGWIGFFNALKGQRIEAKIDEAAEVKEAQAGEGLK